MRALALLAALALVACSSGKSQHDADCPPSVELAKANTALQFIRGELTQAAYDSKMAAFKALCEVG